MSNFNDRKPLASRRRYKKFIELRHLQSNEVELG